MRLSRTLMQHRLATAALNLAGAVLLQAAVMPVAAAAPQSTQTRAETGSGDAPQTGSDANTTTQAGVVTIESDRQQADSGTGIVTATGNVRIVYPDRRVLATARQAQYFSREGRVVLSGDVQVLQDDGSRLLAEQVVYDVNQERVEARPRPGAQVVSIVRMRRGPGAVQPGGAQTPAVPLLPRP